MLNGIHDQSTAYDVLTERPHTLQEAVNLLSWHFFMQKWNQGQTAHPTNSSGKGTKYFRNQKSRKYGGKSSSIVIEDSLVQFGQELTDSITESN